MYLFFIFLFCLFVWFLFCFVLFFVFCLFCFLFVLFYFCLLFFVFVFVLCFCFCFVLSSCFILFCFVLFRSLSFACFSISFSNHSSIVQSLVQLLSRNALNTNLMHGQPDFFFLFLNMSKFLVDKSRMKYLFRAYLMNILI